MWLELGGQGGQGAGLVDVTSAPCVVPLLGGGQRGVARAPAVLGRRVGPQPQHQQDVGATPRHRRRRIGSIVVRLGAGAAVGRAQRHAELPAQCRDRPAVWRAGDGRAAGIEGQRVDHPTDQTIGGGRLGDGGVRVGQRQPAAGRQGGGALGAGTAQRRVVGGVVTAANRLASKRKGTSRRTY